MSFLKTLTMLTSRWSSHSGHPRSPKKHPLGPSSDSGIYSPRRAAAETQKAPGWCEAGWPGKTWEVWPWVRHPHGAWWRFLSLLCHCSSHPLEDKNRTNTTNIRDAPQNPLRGLPFTSLSCNLPSPPALRQLLPYSWPEPGQSHDSQSLHSNKNPPQNRMN